MVKNNLGSPGKLTKVTCNLSSTPEEVRVYSTKTMIIITVPEATPFLSFNQFSFTQTLSCTHLLAPSVLLSSPSTCSPSISHGIFITPSTPHRHTFLPVPPVFSSNTCRTKPPFSISLISSRDRSSCSCWCTTVSSDDVILQEQYKQRCN